MKSSSRIIPVVNRIVIGIAAIGSLCMLAACGTDMLTYAQDAKCAGIGQYNDGNYSDAVGSFRSAVRQDPTDAEAEYWLGLSYEQTQNYHEAINAYKTSLAVMPEWGMPGSIANCTTRRSIGSLAWSPCTTRRIPRSI